MRRWRILLIVVAVVCIGVAVSYPIRYRLQQNSNNRTMEDLAAIRARGLAQLASPSPAPQDATEPQAQDEGRTPPQDETEPPAQDAGQIPPQDAGQTPAENEGQTPAEEPGPTAAPAETGETGDRGEAKAPAQTEHPSTVPAPDATPAPQTQPEPDMTPNPETRTESGQSPEPEKGIKPGQTPEPDTDIEPGQTPEPVKATEPGQTPEPAEKAEPGQTAEPQKEPGQTPEPEKATEPGQTPEPTEEAEPGQTAEPQTKPGQTAEPQTKPGETAEPQQEPGPDITPEPTTQAMAYLLNEAGVHPLGTPTPRPQATPAPQVKAEPTPDRYLRGGAPLPFPMKEKVELDESRILPELREIYELNHDMVGWLCIPGTLVDYPVVQRQDSDFYLTHDFYGQENNNGQIILDAPCDPYTPSYNLVISGHSMKSGSMFGYLISYRNKEYWRLHKIVQFDSLMERKEYVVMAAFFSADYDVDEEGFRYNADIQYRLDADTWLSDIAANQVYDTGIGGEFGDEFLTLTTCSSLYQKNGRFVVVCRRIREGESFN